MKKSASPLYFYFRMLYNEIEKLMKDVFHKEIISYVEQSEPIVVFETTAFLTYYILTDFSSHVNLITENRKVV